MAGDFCSVVGCGNCRSTRKGIGIFRLPQRNKSKEAMAWRKEWLGVLKRYRDDVKFRNMIKKNNIYTCEEHFHPDDIEVYVGAKITKKYVKFGILPTLKLPEKSFPTKVATPRKPRTIVVQAEPTPKEKKYNYKNFEELISRSIALKSIESWKTEVLDDRFVIRKFEPPMLPPLYEITINKELEYFISIYGYFLPPTHRLYAKYFRSLRVVFLSDLIKDIQGWHICKGVNTTGWTKDLIHHLIPHHCDPLSDDCDSQRFGSTTYWRSATCPLLIHETDVEHCDQCVKSDSIAEKDVKRKSKNLTKPAHPNAPLTKTHPDRIILALQQERLKSSQLEKKLSEMSNEVFKLNRIIEIGPHIVSAAVSESAEPAVSRSKSSSRSRKSTSSKTRPTAAVAPSTCSSIGHNCDPPFVSGDNRSTDTSTVRTTTSAITTLAPSFVQLPAPGTVLSPVSINPGSNMPGIVWVAAPLSALPINSGKIVSTASDSVEPVVSTTVISSD